MKICILTSAHPPYDARIYYKEACSLRKAGYEVVLIAPTALDSNPERIVTSEGITVRFMPPVHNRIERFFNLKNIFRLARDEKADLYHFHDPDLIGTGLKLQRSLGKPVIYDVHEYYGDSLRTRYWIPLPLRRIAASLFDFVEKRAARKFTAIITVNEHMAGLFKKYNPEGTVLFNYPLSGKFQFPRPEKEDEFNSRPTILYLGGINKERGLEVILEAMTIVRDIYPEAVCEMVGPVDTGGLSSRFLPLEQWQESGNVRMRGKVSYEEVPAILEQSNIALVPLLPTLNYQKAIPVKLLEYMSAGLPVVGSRFGHIERIIREENCGLLAEPGDPHSLAEKICRLIEHPGETLFYAQKGWDAFHRRYSWEREEEKLFALYDRVLNQD